MDTCGLGERISVANLHPNLARQNGVEHLCGCRLQIRPRGGVRRERRPGQVQRSFLGQDANGGIA